MAELADAHGSGPCEYCFRGGSNPLIRTIGCKSVRISTILAFFLFWKSALPLKTAHTVFCRIGPKRACKKGGNFYEKN